MSFYRLDRPRSESNLSTAKYRRSRKKNFPDWDDTVNDLSVYKATPEEIARRKASHLSTNLDNVRQDKFCKEISKARSRSLTPCSRGNTIVKEVLHNQEQFQDVLARSDKAMAVVKDLFGDAPQRHRGIPNITVAPGTDGDQRYTLTNLMPPEPVSQLEQLSETLMNQSALNEDVSSRDEPGTFQSRLDMERFQKLLQMEKDQFDTPTTNHGSQAGKSEYTDYQQVSDEINATGKVKRIKSHQPRSRVSQTERNTTDLQKALVNMENELQDYEESTGKQPVAEQRTDSGYTVSLVTTVTKIVTYLKTTEQRLQCEIRVREHLSRDVEQLHQLIDGLTADLISTQEEYGNLLKHYEQHKNHSEQQIEHLKNLYKTLQENRPNTVDQENDETAMDGPSNQKTSVLSAVPNRVQDVQPAIMLSPPRQSYGQNWSKVQQPRSIFSNNSTETIESPSDFQMPGPELTSKMTSDKNIPKLTIGGHPSNPHTLSTANVLNLDDQILALSRERIDARQKLEQLHSMQQQLLTRIPHDNLVQTSEHLELGPPEQQNGGPREDINSESDTLSEELQQQDYISGIEHEKIGLEFQINELNQQHNEAKSRLALLMNQQVVTAVETVSPSISPIPNSDNTQNIPRAEQVKQDLITSVDVHLPHLEMSATSTPSSKSPIFRPIRDTNAEDDGWFSLSHHT